MRYNYFMKRNKNFHWAYYSMYSKTCCESSAAKTDIPLQSIIEETTTHDDSTANTARIINYMIKYLGHEAKSSCLL